MKVFSVIFALIVLMESTIQASCAGLHERQEEVCCSSDQSMNDCETETVPVVNDTTKTDAQHGASDECNSGCNPFKACACCIGAGPIGYFMLLSSSTDEVPARYPAALFLPYADPLPDMYGVFPEHPPRIS